MNDRFQQSHYGESRPFRLGHPAGRAGASATVTRAIMERQMIAVNLRVIATVPETCGIHNLRQAGLRTMWCGAVYNLDQ